VKLWDVEAGAPKLTLKHKDIVQSLSWSADGSQLVTTSRDKKLRVWDVRQEAPAIEVQGHSGAKSSRAVWLGEHDRIATTGFSRMSDRQLALWDARKPGEPIGGYTILDSISGVCMPFWDEGTQCLYLAGKGDGNIRYYEYENDKFEYLTEYKSGEPQRGIAFMPKRGINLHDNEVLRGFKTVNDSYIQPVSFIVPRRAEMFQSDIYPPTTGLNAGTTAQEWFGGKTALPPKISLESVYEGDGLKEVPAEYKPPQAAEPIRSPSLTKTEAPKPVEAPAPSPVTRGPPSSMTDNKASLAAGASKFADKDEESEDETSSFEEVPKRVERPSATTVRQEEKTRGPTFKQEPEPSKPTPAPTAAPISSAPAPAASTPTSSSTPAPAPTAAGAAAGLKDFLADIKNTVQQQSDTLQRQNQIMSDQSDQIALLLRKVGTLETKMGSSGGGDREKDERIRELELELEEARS
jgi:coronin-1B/1C/6